MSVISLILNIKPHSLITQSDSIKYFIFNGTIAYIQLQSKLAFYSLLIPNYMTKNSPSALSRISVITILVLFVKYLLFQV